MRYIILLSNCTFMTVNTLKEVEEIILDPKNPVLEVYEGKQLSFERVEKVKFGKAA